MIQTTRNCTGRRSTTGRWPAPSASLPRTDLPSRQSRSRRTRNETMERGCSSVCQVQGERDVAHYFRPLPDGSWAMPPVLPTGSRQPRRRSEYSRPWARALPQGMSRWKSRWKRVAACAATSRTTILTILSVRDIDETLPCMVRWPGGKEAILQEAGHIGRPQVAEFVGQYNA